MTRLLSLTLLTACLVLLSLTPPLRHEFRVKVSAGAHDCTDTPVHLDIDLPAGGKLQARAFAKGRQTPAQIEDLGDGQSRVWWIVDKIAAGETVEYKLEIGQLEQDEQSPSFGWKDSSADGLTSSTLAVGERSVLQYMHTKFSNENRELTKKPYHHVFAPDGSQLITKGHGGLYPHHRGIFFGYNRCKVNGKSFDIWHAHKGEHSVHVKELRRIEGPVLGGHVVRIHWNDRDGKTFATETRRLVAFHQASGRHLIEFRTHLEATDGPVELRGDPQHAGVQFRAAQFVAKNQKKTSYLRPASWKDLPEAKQINFPGNKQHKDMPWNAVRFEVENRRYTVAYLSHPKNPGNAQSSERLYGRFGEYFPYDLGKDRPLDVTYRWWISSSHDVKRSEVEGRYQALAAPVKVELIK